MTAELVLQLFGGAGFLAGIAALLHFLNTRKSTKSKGSADAYLAWRTFTSGAFEDRDREHQRVLSQRDKLYQVRNTLVDIAQELISNCRRHGATTDELEPYQDRLDAVRQL